MVGLRSMINRSLLRRLNEIVSNRGDSAVWVFFFPSVTASSSTALQASQITSQCLVSSPRPRHRWSAPSVAETTGKLVSRSVAMPALLTTFRCLLLPHGASTATTEHAISFAIFAKEPLLSPLRDYRELCEANRFARSRARGSLEAERRSAGYVYVGCSRILGERIFPRNLCFSLTPSRTL
jgi:hypothetical protein